MTETKTIFKPDFITNMQDKIRLDTSQLSARVIAIVESKLTAEFITNLNLVDKAVDIVFKEVCSPLINVFTQKIVDQVLESITVNQVETSTVYEVKTNTVNQVETSTAMNFEEDTEEYYTDGFSD